MKFLIIDDEEYRHVYLSKLLKAKFENAEIHNVYNSSDAIDIFRTTKFDVVFFDHDLGDFSLNGSQLAYELLSDTSCHLPELIIVHSSNYEGAKNIQSKFVQANILSACFNILSIISDSDELVRYIESSFVTIS